MSKKSRRNRAKLDPYRFEAPLDLMADDDDIDLDHLEGDLDDDDWWSDADAEARMSTRRKIERRRERRALYSELNDWESFGQRGSD